MYTNENLLLATTTYLQLRKYNCCTTLTFLIMMTVTNTLKQKDMTVNFVQNHAKYIISFKINFSCF